MAEGEYVYCIISQKDVPQHFPVKGIEDREVYTVPYKYLTAVVSKATVKEFDPNEENTEKHKAVALHVLKDCTVLPVAFGMVFKTTGVLRQTMKNVYALLWKSLRAVDNKVELGVKLVFPKEAEKNFAGWSKGKSKEEFRKECEKAFVEALDKFAVKSKKDKLFSERLVFNYAFLVERDKIGQFSEVLGELDDRYPGLKTQYTGPWPPYNFVDIKIMSKGRG